MKLAWCGQNKRGCYKMQCQAEVVAGELVYVATFESDDLCGLVAEGATETEARSELKHLLIEHLEHLDQHKVPHPEFDCVETVVKPTIGRRAPTSSMSIDQPVAATLSIETTPR